MQNQRLWVNAIIQALSAELELVRQEFLEGWNAEKVDETKLGIADLFDKYSKKLEHRPFTDKQKSD